MSQNPYGNASQRGRGWMLITTVVLLLIATGAWITTYTQAMDTTTTSENVQKIDLQ